jgi:hypothetical protein
MAFFPNQLTGREIKESDRIGLVKKSWDEEKREELVEIFGDLSQYQIIWIVPEILEVHLLKNTASEEDPEFKTFHWRHGMNKNDVRSKDLSSTEMKAILIAVDSLLDIGKNDTGNASDKEASLDHPDRVFLYKRYRNGDVWDWRCVSIRSNSQNEHVKLLREKLLLHEAPTDDDVKNFLQEQ